MGRPCAPSAMARRQPGCAHGGPGLVVRFCLGRTRTGAGVGPAGAGADCVGDVYRRPASGRAGGHAIAAHAPDAGAAPFPLALPADPGPCGAGRSGVGRSDGGDAAAGTSAYARHSPGCRHAGVFLRSSFSRPDPAGGVAAVDIFFARIPDWRTVHGGMPVAGGVTGGAGSVCPRGAGAGLAGRVFRRAGVAQLPCDRTLGVGSLWQGAEMGCGQSGPGGGDRRRAGVHRWAQPLPGSAGS